MSEKSGKYPWKNGFWLANINDGIVSIIEENSEIVRSFAELEYHPDLPILPNNQGVLEFGDFGQMDKDLMVCFISLSKLSRFFKNIYRKLPN